MRRQSVAVGVPILALLALPLGASAAKPSFDCAKAEGAVETLICGDDALADLDRKLAGVHDAALRRAPDSERETLAASRRGFLKARNGCEKDYQVRQCVESSYRGRIVDLQATYGLARARGPVTYTCDDRPPTRVIARFFDTDPPSVRIDLDRPLLEIKASGTALIAQLTHAASGARYTGRHFEFWTRGKDATLERDGEPPARCAQKP
jgi:uncharacterized protein